MSLIKEQQQNSKKTAIPRHVVVRKTRKNPIKLMLRWVYWLVLIGVIAIVVMTSFEAGMSMYKGGQ
ncbi:hypothetical protein EIK76_00675 [Rheinheimera mesophila]|uniref:Uncharacterized protein n=1 Tax=Rheinheimera mesophila TaxID=1547515 RepID=A0A3P3QQQ0_9GAMM|nr:hypothetical protein [Rheinheimera mesophila]KKL00206.1 hypothetical protein SD53_15460 [Rheinheimera mesophila]RRJ22633.1 hypothetical protein EIK76_00675 [Rheinheimera mesophila]